MGGAGVNLHVEGTGLDPAQGPPVVETVWSRPLGPGYTQVALEGARAFLGYSDGTRDILAALSLETGEELWTYDMGPTWKGRDGSDDGPISSPAVSDGLVFGLGPRGRLFALRTDTGTPAWQTELTEEHGARPFSYGVSTSPLLLGDLLVVQNGGDDGRSVMAFEAKTGKVAWQTGDDRVAYQSPLLADLQGRRQLVAVTGTKVLGLDSSEGTVLWQSQYRNEPENHSNTVVVTGSDSYAVTTQIDVAGFRLSSAGGTTTVEETWRNSDLKRSYGIPVVQGGNLYGWSRDFFVGLDAATGERHWKIRGVGPGSALLLDRMLALWTVDGRLLFADPSSEGLGLLGETQLLDNASLTNPTWTGDGLLLRAPDRLLRVRLTPGRGALVTDTDPALVPTGRLASFVDAWEAAPEDARGALTSSFLGEHEIPLVDDDGTVTFLFRSDAEDVALIPGGVPVESAVPMERVAGDLWFRTESLDRRGAYVYSFEVDGERSTVDPHNARRSPNMLPSSLLLMPDYEPAEALAPGAPEPAQRGTTEDHNFASAILENERNVTVYLPAGYDGGHKYPLLLVASGIDRILGRTPEILDAVMGVSVEPAVAVFVDLPEPAEMNVFYETLASRGPLFSRMILEELLPWLEERYSLSTKASDRVLTGTMLHGARVLDIALRHPDVFGAVAAQSPNLNAAFERNLERILESATDTPRVYIDWCARDSEAHLEATSVKEPVARLLPKLRGRGIDLFAQELPGGYGWEMFSTQTENILKRFLPLRSDA